MLRRAAPHVAAIGRMGGEEFALLFEHINQEGARLNAEAIRIAASQTSQTLPPFTVSGGVTTIISNETLSDAMPRADAALYQAAVREGPDMHVKQQCRSRHQQVAGLAHPQVLPPCTTAALWRSSSGTDSRRVEPNRRRCSSPHAALFPFSFARDASDEAKTVNF